MNYGYVRVSTKDQKEDRQMDAIMAVPIDEKRIFVDKESGKDFNRTQYKLLKRRLKKGDLLVVKSIDRLGRNYAEILEEWRVLTRKKGVDIAVLDMPLLDTRQGKDLTGTFIADLVLQILSYVAQTERENIRKRQAEGIRSAKIRGIQFGRPPLQKPKEFDLLRAKWEQNQISSRQAAKILNISHTTFIRWAK